MSGKSIFLTMKRSTKVISVKKKELTKIDSRDVNKILLSKKVPYGTKNSFKYFIWYNDGDSRPLYIELPQIIKYAKYFDTNKAISLKVIDEKNVKKICLKLRKKLAA